MTKLCLLSLAISGRYSEPGYNLTGWMKQKSLHLFSGSACEIKKQLDVVERNSSGYISWPNDKLDQKG